MFSLNFYHLSFRRKGSGRFNGSEGILPLIFDLDDFVMIEELWALT